METPRLPSLVPLRIPGGWMVEYNELREIDPSTVVKEHDRCWLLTEDLVQLHHPASGLVVDVGWYPDGDPTGEFGIKVIVETDWARPVYEAATASLQEAVALIEGLLERPPPLPVDRLVELLRSVDPNHRSHAAQQLAWRGEVSAIDAIKEAILIERDEETIDRFQQSLRALIHERRRRASNTVD